MLVSAHAFGGVPERAVRIVLDKACPYVTQALLDEYRDVPPRLLADGKINREQLQSLISGMAAYVSAARVVEAKARVTLCRDPEDDILLECCRAARATVLITGDRDLLDLAAEVAQVTGLRRLRILTPRAYLERSRRRPRSRSR